MKFYTAPIALLHASIADIAENISYIERELPGLKLPDSTRLHIGQTCATFQSTLYDVRTEIRNLEDKLGMHPGQPPFDPDIKNPDPRVTMGFIADWLWIDIEGMHRTVSRLEEVSKAAPDLGSAYLLVAESATNILSAHMNVKDALDMIGGQLEHEGSQINAEQPPAGAVSASPPSSNGFYGLPRSTLPFPRLMRLLSTPFQRAAFVLGILGIAPWVPMRFFRELSFSDGVRDYLSNVFGLPVKLWLGTAWLGSWYDWLFIPSLCLVAVAFLWPWTGASVWRWIREGGDATSPTNPTNPGQSPPSVTTPLYAHITVESMQAAIDEFKEQNKGKTWMDLYNENEARDQAAGDRIHQQAKPPTMQIDPDADLTELGRS